MYRTRNLLWKIKPRLDCPLFTPELGVVCLEHRPSYSEHGLRRSSKSCHEPGISWLAIRGHMPRLFLHQDIL
jgi:hypothetical protein